MVYYTILNVRHTVITFPKMAYFSQFSLLVLTEKNAFRSCGVVTSTTTAVTGATRQTATGPPAEPTSSPAPTASASQASGDVIWKKIVR